MTSAIINNGFIKVSGNIIIGTVKLSDMKNKITSLLEERNVLLKQLTNEITLLNVDGSPTNIPTIYVSENVALNTIIGTANSTNGSTLEITGEGPFVIDDEGNIMVTGSLNYEDIHQYEMNVVSTSPSETSSTPLLIKLTNETELPLEGSEYTFQIGENEQIGKIVGVIDRVSDEFIRYSIVGGSDSFDIDEHSGTIRIARELDFELNSEHRLFVSIADNEGNSVMANVSIFVKDVNEPPFFSQSNTFTFSIEKRFVETTVGTLHGNDIDPGDYLTFSIVDSPYFSINNFGEIVVATNLPPTTHTYPFTVRMTDVGGLSTEKNVSVTYTQPPHEILIKDSIVVMTSLDGYYNPLFEEDANVSEINGTDKANHITIVDDKNNTRIAGIDLSSESSYTITWASSFSGASASYTLEVRHPPPYFRCNGVNIDDDIYYIEMANYQEPHIECIYGSVVKKSERYLDNSNIVLEYTCEDVYFPKNLVVNIHLDQAPTITLNGGNPVELEYNGTWNEPGYQIGDENPDGVKVVVSGDVNTTVPGEYTLTYTATDEGGNSTTVTRRVIVNKAKYDVIQIKKDILLNDANYRKKGITMLYDTLPYNMFYVHYQNNILDFKTANPKYIMLFGLPFISNIWLEVAYNSNTHFHVPNILNYEYDIRDLPNFTPLTDIEFITADENFNYVDVKRSTPPVVYTGTSFPTENISTVYTANLKYLYMPDSLRIYFKMTGDALGANGHVITNVDYYMKMPGVKVVFSNLPYSVEQFDGTPDDPPNYEILSIFTQSNTSDCFRNPKNSLEYKAGGFYNPINQNVEFVFVLPPPVSYPGNDTITNYESAVIEHMTIADDGSFVLISKDIQTNVNKDDTIVFDDLPTSDPIARIPYDTAYDSPPNRTTLRVLSKNILSNQVYLSNIAGSKKYNLVNQVTVRYGHI